MDNIYVIYCAPGTGGLFLASVIANFLGLPVTPKFSDSGNSHDLGNGLGKGQTNLLIFWANIGK